MVDMHRHRLGLRRYCRRCRDVRHPDEGEDAAAVVQPLPGRLDGSRFYLLLCLRYLLLYECGGWSLLQPDDLLASVIFFDVRYWGKLLGNIVDYARIAPYVESL